MSDDAENPYRSPEVTAVSEKPLAAQGALTETMLLYLKGASPWLRFIGIVGFIIAGLSALGGFVSLAVFPQMAEVWEEVWAEVPGFESFGDVFSSFFGGTMAVNGVVGAVLIFFPSLFIYRFGEKIRSYLSTGMEQDLEQALRNNKSFWKFVGIVCIVSLAIIPIMIVFSVIAVVAMAMGGG